MAAAAKPVAASAPDIAELSSRVEEETAALGLIPASKSPPNEALASLLAALTLSFPLPAPPAPPAPAKPAAAAAPAKPGVGAKAGVAAKPVAGKAPAGRAAAAPAKPAAPAKAPAGRGTPAKPAAGAAGKAAPAAAAAAATKVPEGKLEKLSLSLDPALPLVATKLTLALSPSMPLAEGETVTLTLPGFSGPKEGSLEASMVTVVEAQAQGAPPPAGGEEAAKPALRFEAAWAAEGGKMVFTVGAGGCVAAGQALQLQVLPTAGLMAPCIGIRRGDAARPSASASGKGGAAGDAPIDECTEVRACRLDAKLRSGLLRAGWALMRGGPCLSSRKDYAAVSLACFQGVLEDVEGVEEAEAKGQALEACAGRVCVMKSPKYEVKEGDLTLSRQPSGGDGGSGGAGGEGGLKEAEEALGRCMGYASEAEARVKLAVVRVHIASEEYQRAEDMLAAMPAKGDAQQACLIESAHLRISQYLLLLNTSPDIDRLSSALEAAVKACKDAAAACKGVSSAILHMCAGQAWEDQKHVSLVHSSAAEGGAEAGVDQAATDAANLDEVKAILKNRGVFGAPEIDEQIKELEGEYHDNINFGLHQAADVVANLLEWYRAYRTRLQRGGDVYEKKADDGPKEDPKLLASLKEALACYKSAQSAWGSAAEVVNAQAAVGRVSFLLGEFDSAIDTLKPLASATSVAGAGAGLYQSMSVIGRDDKNKMPSNPASLLPPLEPALKECQSLATRLVEQGDATVCQADTFYAGIPLRLTNPHVITAALRTGEVLASSSKHEDADRVLLCACVCAEAVKLTGVSLGAKSEAKKAWRKAKALRAQCLATLGRPKAAFGDLTALSEDIKGARDADALGLMLQAGELSVSLWDANAKSHIHLGDALLENFEHNPQKRGDAAVLDKAEAEFKKAIELEGKAIPQLTDKPAAAAPAPAAAAGARAPPPAAKPGPAAAAKPGPAKAPAVARGASSKALPAKGDASKAAPSPAAAASGGGGGGGTNPKSAGARLGVAKCLSERAGGDVSSYSDEVRSDLVAAYQAVVDLDKRDVEAYMKIGELLEFSDPALSAQTFRKYPLNLAEPNKDDAFIAGELVRLMMRGKDYQKWKWSESEEFLSVAQGLVVMATVQSLDVISNYVDKLEAADQTTALCEIYAKVNKREIDNQTMMEFFQRKAWIPPKKDALRLPPAAAT